MLYHYKGFLIIYSQATQDYTVYLNDNVKCSGVNNLTIACMTIDLTLDYV